MQISLKKKRGKRQYKRGRIDIFAGTNSFHIKQFSQNLPKQLF